MSMDWEHVIREIEDIYGIDLPQSLKKDAVRICGHLYRQNPERGRFDARWSFSKVANYLSDMIEPFRTDPH